MDISVTRAAEALGMSRKTLSALLNGRAGISPEMAVRLSLAFGASAESWLNQQSQYDLWQAEKKRKCTLSLNFTLLPYQSNNTLMPIGTHKCYTLSHETNKLEFHEKSTAYI